MNRYEKMRAELDAEVVAKVNGVDATRADLNAAFERIKPTGHWKNRIDAVVGLTDHERDLTREAIVFFTGSIPTFEVVEHGKYRVRAAGYFLTIGA